VTQSYFNFFANNLYQFDFSKFYIYPNKLIKIKNYSLQIAKPKAQKKLNPNAELTYPSAQTTWKTAGYRSMTGKAH